MAVHFYVTTSNREKCKDQTINSDGCYMYYRLSRSNVFSTHTTR